LEKALHEHLAIKSLEDALVFGAVRHRQGRICIEDVKLDHLESVTSAANSLPNASQELALTISQSYFIFELRTAVLRGLWEDDGIESSSSVESCLKSRNSGNVAKIISDEVMNARVHLETVCLLRQFSVILLQGNPIFVNDYLDLSTVTTEPLEVWLSKVCIFPFKY